MIAMTIVLKELIGHGLQDVIKQSQPIRLGLLADESLLSKKHLILPQPGLLSCIEDEPFQSWSRMGLVISTGVNEYGHAAFSCRACPW